MSRARARGGGLLPAGWLLLLVSALAAGLAFAGAVLAWRGLAMRSRVPATAHLYALVMRRHAEDAVERTAAIAGVSVARLRRLDELLPGAGGGRPVPERLRVIDLEVGLGDDRRPLAVEEIGRVPGIVEVVDVSSGDRHRFTAERASELLASGLLLLALGGGAYASGLGSAARLAARESRDEIAARYLLGAEPGRLWMRLALFCVAVAMTGVLVTTAAALGGLALIGRGGPQLPPGALGWLAAGALAWLVGTAGLSTAVTRRAVMGLARTALALSLALVAPRAGLAAEPGEVGLGHTAHELRRVGRELAVARRAAHRAEQTLADSERILLGALVSGDAAREVLARARWKTEGSELARWQRRCRHLRARREELRTRQRAARLDPPIEPRVLPVEGEVAVPFDRPAPRAPVAAFRHGIGLRVGGGETIVATAPGRVAFAGPLAGAGSVVVVDHGRRVYSVYGRVGAPLVALGEKVASGEPVARAPERPGVFYFSVRQRGRAVDPMRWIRSAREASGARS